MAITTQDQHTFDSDKDNITNDYLQSAFSLTANELNKYYNNSDSEARDTTVHLMQGTEALCNMRKYPLEPIICDPDDRT